MKKKRGQGLLFAVIAIIGAALIAGEVWFFYGMFQKKQITRAVDRAWAQAVSPDDPPYLRAIDERSHYEIEKIKKGEVYEITVTVRGVDLGGRLREISLEDFPKTEDEDEINDYLLDLIEEADETEVTTVLYALPEGEGYSIQFSDTFVDAMSGMVYSYTRELADTWTEGYGW